MRKTPEKLEILFWRIYNLPTTNGKSLILAAIMLGALAGILSVVIWPPAP